MSAAGPAVRVAADTPTPPPDWDARAVAVPGGHVMQSATWAQIRAGQGHEPRFVTFDDGGVALVLLRRSRGLPGSAAVVRRGPAHGGQGGTVVAARALALARWARTVGARTLELDPELPADAGFAAAMDEAGFEISEGPEPSIHVMRRTLEPGLDEESLLRSFSKSTRQRIRAAEAAGTVVLETAEPARLTAFAELLHERADAVGMQLQAGTGFVTTWRRLIEAGLARVLVAEHEGLLVGGLLLFRQGGIQATAYSADRVDQRRALPGTMHLLRHRAIHDALVEGCPAIDLGGVDLPGHRRPPATAAPNRGLYEHKRGFGAEWLEREPPRRLVLRPGAERLAQARRRLLDAVRGVRR